MNKINSYIGSAVLLGSALMSGCTTNGNTLENTARQNAYHQSQTARFNFNDLDEILNAVTYENFDVNIDNSSAQSLIDSYSSNEYLKNFIDTNEDDKLDLTEINTFQGKVNANGDYNVAQDGENTFSVIKEGDKVVGLQLNSGLDKDSLEEKLTEIKTKKTEFSTQAKTSYEQELGKYNTNKGNYEKELAEYNVKIEQDPTLVGKLEEPKFEMKKPSLKTTGSNGNEFGLSGYELNLPKIKFTSGDNFLSNFGFEVNNMTYNPEEIKVGLAGLTEIVDKYDTNLDSILPSSYELATTIPEKSQKIAEALSYFYGLNPENAKRFLQQSVADVRQQRANAESDSYFNKALLMDITAGAIYYSVLLSNGTKAASSDPRVGGGKAIRIGGGVLGGGTP